MSNPATIVRIRDGKIEYHERGDSFEIMEAVAGGPEAINDYIDGNGQYAPHEIFEWRTSINPREDEGAVLLDEDKNVIIVFGGEIELSMATQRGYMSALSESPLWIGWDLRWAYKGLYDVAKYLGQTSELLEDQHYGRICESMHGGVLRKEEVLGSFEEMASLIAVRRCGKTLYYPLDTIFPEDFLHYGADELSSMLEDMGGLRELNIANCDWVKGLLIDHDTKEVTMWAILGEVVAEKLEEAWPGWAVGDLEGDAGEFVIRATSVASDSVRC